MNTPGSAVLADPQTSISWVLKPPRNFETLYQGEPRTTPIPLVKADAEGEFVALDDFAGKPGIASNLQRFVPVPLGGTLYILIPRATYRASGSSTEPPYKFQLRWRLRTLTDWNRGAADANPTHPWALLPSKGNQQGPASTPTGSVRTVMPSFCSEVLAPTFVGTQNLVLVGPSTYGTSSQGMYLSAGPTQADVEQSVGPLCFPPFLRPALGNELSICVARDDGGNWDFTDPAQDAAFSNLYGTNVAASAPHDFFPGIGVYLISMSRSTTP